jgi:hypothetical protein
LFEALQQRPNLHVVGINLAGRSSCDDRPQSYRSGTSEAGERSNERRDNNRLPHP